ncbi:hypothetical protein Q8W71_25510 [Methylobacterium sp. NEAU 140]|uniref:hypothetical protein n=1 Tax=Methylobacterium sp. NEAU 140 TaxID=3064945 RepID=UPI0027353FEA|nr:hypothetical protein [Methylobacterium sp. NEAU 140]MDP4025995.1 hypothetical protein [Methylobacterium sp. NEAU 140]
MLSLGFGCESRQTIEQISVTMVSMPFDNIITPKKLLLESLRFDGKVFEFNSDDCKPTWDRVPFTYGIEAKGLFYMHEFPIDADFSQRNEWAQKFNALSAKYQRRWLKFKSLCQDDNYEKIFFLANSQHLFNHFYQKGGQYSDSFGIDADFVLELIEELEHFGAQNFRIVLLCGNIDDYISVNSLPDRYKDLLLTRFVGTITYPMPDILVRELSYTLFKSAFHGPDISAVCGTYIGGMQIMQTSDNTALITNFGIALGEVRLFPGGYIVVFNGEANFTMKACINDNKLRFANRDEWTRIES